MKIESLPNTNDKAFTVTSSGETSLFSNDKEVAKYDEITGKLEVYSCENDNTLQHINSFFKQYNLSAITKEQLIERYK